MKHNISLLRRLGLEVGKSLPCFQVLCADDSCLSGCGGKVGRGLVLALGAEHAVYPAVLVLGKSHIVNIGLVRLGVGETHGEIPEAEVINRAVALCHCKEGLSVVALNSCHKVILAVKEDSTRVQHRIDAQPLHKMGIGCGVHIVSPDNRCVCSCKHGVLISVIDAVVGVGNHVPACDKLLILSYHSRLVLFKFVHQSYSF